MTDLDKSVIRINGLEFRYGEGDFRLHIPALEVERGTTAAFIGPCHSSLLIR